MARVNKIPEELKLLPVNKITPVHSVGKDSIYRKLFKDFSNMKTGWSGRPLLVVKIRKKYRALTGSHRYAAAKDAGLKRVPCMVIDHPKARKIIKEFDIEATYTYYKSISKKLKHLDFHLASLLMSQDYN